MEKKTLSNTTPQSRLDCEQNQQGGESRQLRELKVLEVTRFWD